jgi:hypothetical protein
MVREWPAQCRGPLDPQGHPKILSNRFVESIFGIHPLSVGAPRTPLRSEAKGQAEACPDGTRTISRNVRRAINVQLARATSGQSRPLPCSRASAA